MNGASGKYYSGLSGLVLPFPKYKFPPGFENASRLTYYATIFNSIEINRSFYVLPNGKTLAKWANQVPEEFTFTFKLWKQITHAKGLAFEESDVKKFIDAINAVGLKKACLLIQFAASVKSQYLRQLDTLLSLIQSCDSTSTWNVALEFRDSSWYTEDVYEMIEAYGASIVMHDKAKTASPHLTLNSQTVYVRFHGPEGNYRGSYTEDFLQEYATYICEWLDDGKSVYVYFNNTMGKAFDNLVTLNKMISINRSVAS
jgi:uncharacterized protein YecE (DUF72 family)